MESRCGQLQELLDRHVRERVRAVGLRDGELVDRWGTPYFFHSVSAEKMEIVSAGPDKELWTDDDVVSLQ